jgi:hypothetical protein
MRLDSLIHITKAVAAMLEGERLVIFGSASLLASFPELGTLTDSPLLTTYDVDIIPYPFEEEVGLMLDESFGEDRKFHQLYGYHADIVRPKITETFPRDWEKRLVPLAEMSSVMCLDPHDMAAVKCLLGREKDRIQLSFLIKKNYLKTDLIKQRITEINISQTLLEKANHFVQSLEV